MSHFYSIREFNYHPRSLKPGRRLFAAPNNFLCPLVSYHVRSERCGPRAVTLLNPHEAAPHHHTSFFPLLAVSFPERRLYQKPHECKKKKRFTLLTQMNRCDHLTQHQRQASSCAGGSCIHQCRCPTGKSTCFRTREFALQSCQAAWNILV